MKPIKITLILFSIVVTICNCKDECTPEKINIVDLPKYIPYTGNDTLRFLHNNTDTQTFIGQGLERFYVTQGPKDDYDCPEDYESVFIRFKNTQNNDEIKIENIYQPTTGATYLYRFYYKKIFSGEYLGNFLLTRFINGYSYNNIGVFAQSKDTLSYILFRFPSMNNEYSGIIKVKYPGDTLTLIR